jgi:hypothetical protein
MPARAGTRERGKELVSVEGGLEVGARHLHYVDAITHNLRNYDLGAAPLVFVAAGVYPFADASTKVDAGIVGGYARAVGVSSAPSGSGEVGTDWWRFHAGVRMRVRPAPGLVLGVTGAYGGETYAFSSSSIDSEAPGVTYRFLRAGADARMAFGRFAASGSLAYDVMLSAGAIEQRFPHSSVGGLEASLGPSFALTRSVEIGATASYRRFFYAMHPLPGEAYVAGGALDEMMGLDARVRYVF